MDQEQPKEIDIQATPVQEETTVAPADTTSAEKDPVEDLGDAVNWQKEFEGRAKQVSAEIRVILQKYECDMVAMTRLLEVEITIPVSFKDLRHQSPAQAIPLVETK